jgi:hypothetical protein
MIEGQSPAEQYITPPTPEAQPQNPTDLLNAAHRATDTARLLLANSFLYASVGLLGSSFGARGGNSLVTTEMTSPSKTPQEFLAKNMFSLIELSVGGILTAVSVYKELKNVSRAKSDIFSAMGVPLPENNTTAGVGESEEQ